MTEPKYHSYLLRLWQEGTESESHWRFVVVNLIEGQQWGFASMEQMVAFLIEQVDALSAPDSGGSSDLEHGDVPG
jgi:hypothetical protein